MSSFQHDIAGGQGNLIAASVQSPNFSAGSAGWQIRKDGSAEFNNLTLRGTFNGTDYVINSSGAFFYSSTPALGNLIVSIAAVAGTDPFGNAYPLGFNSTLAGQSTAILGNSVNWTNGTSISGASVGALALGGTPGTNWISTPLPFNQPVIASVPGTPQTPETWHPMTLLNSWTNNASFSAAQYRKVASPPNSVEIIGHIAGNAATAATFATLPAGYRPVTAQGFPAGTNAGNGGATMVTNVRCDTSGNLTINNSAALPVAATFLFHGTVSLDA